VGGQICLHTRHISLGVVTILGSSANKLVDSAKQTGGPEGSPSAKAQVDIWSTDATRARERFSYWRDAVCHAIFNISIEAPPDRFSARVAARSAGPLRFAITESSGYQSIRTRRDIDSAPSDHYSVFAQVHGQSIIHQCGESVTFNPNDICISDGRYPLRADMNGAGCRAFAVIPRVIVDRRAPWLTRNPIHKLTADSPFVDLARRHVLELTSGDSTSESAMSLLTDNLCNLLALGSATDVETNRLQPELQIEALLAFCRQNLHDPELSPQRAADHLRISVRTLHLRFKQIGQTFGQWILEKRLEACREALCDPNQRALNISQIAYRWGFNDLSYFNKAFRARFEQSPRAWRNGLEA
jgi:AraC family transcriptional regulator, positive regulator of tynA and feaB